MRGGVSSASVSSRSMLRSSPHAWGCFYAPLSPFPLLPVFPTCVGVFLIRSSAGTRSTGLPHMRGGVSQLGVRQQTGSKSSPHAWGCFYHLIRELHRRRVFPTCVGVFLWLPTDGDAENCLPHMRGGVSLQLAVELTDAGSSPHVWGCFFITCERIWLYPVFPTCVEVFSPFKCRQVTSVRISQMKGDS